MAASMRRSTTAGTGTVEASAESKAPSLLRCCEVAEGSLSD